MRSTRIRLAVLLRVMVGLCVLASTADADDRLAPHTQRDNHKTGLPAYDTAVRSDAELASELSRTCDRAVAADRPLLVEFSAPWCSDCLVLHRMKQDEALATELAQWPVIVINVGEFEEHPELLEAFDVRSIARWVVLRPQSCEAPIFEWPRLAQRTLEPESGNERNVSPDDLAEWLEPFRTR